MHQSSPHLSYTGEFKEINGVVGFIKDGQAKTTGELDFDRKVTIKIEEELEEDAQGIPIKITKITECTVNSINELLKINKDFILNRPNTTVSVLDYFLHQ